MCSLSNFKNHESYFVQQDRIEISVKEKVFPGRGDQGRVSSHRARVNALEENGSLPFQTFGEVDRCQKLQFHRHRDKDRQLRQIVWALLGEEKYDENKSCVRKLV